ncbi:lung seven transmembrane receptor-domain-containing protein [Salix suchowensis]|nr:lung seven transmembrane receptor-domain-containing protein [Salix suchowensis]
MTSVAVVRKKVCNLIALFISHCSRYFENSAQGESGTGVPFHPVYEGTILFHNTFEGKLPATDYPKVNVSPITDRPSEYVILVSLVLFRNAPLVHHTRSRLGLALLPPCQRTTSYAVAILDAGRNSLSFFMLLVVSLGLSVVRESLGRTMLKCQLLAAAHFVFGILYAVGIVELELESTSAFVLLIFIIPLAFTLSGFLLWIMYALNVIVIAVFFVVSSMSFSGRMAEVLEIQMVATRWLACTAVSRWLLRNCIPLEAIRKQQKISSFAHRPKQLTYPPFTLSMSDELAQDEEDAEDYDLEALESRTHARDEDDDDNATLVGDRRGGPAPLRDDHVVFEIGDEDAGSDDEDESKKQGRIKLQSSENLPGDAQERQGLIGNGASRDRND